MTRDELVALWRTQTTERDRATVEAEIWGAASAAERKAAGNCEKFLRGVLGIPMRQVRVRTNLIWAGKAADALWLRVDGPEHLAPEAARGLLKRAKLRSAAEAICLAEAVDRELAEYDTWRPHRTEDGRLYRKQAQRNRRGMRANAVGAARDRWQTVRAAIWRVVDAELEGVADVHARATLRSQIEAEVSAMMALLNERIRRSRQNASLNGAPPAAPANGRKALRDACAILSVDPPSTVARVDHATYMAAKKNFRALVREYHPDASGTEDTRGRYQAVVAALATVEESYRGIDAAAATVPEETAHEHGDSHE